MQVTVHAFHHTICTGTAIELHEPGMADMQNFYTSDDNFMIHTH